jgi:putative DNA-invertase from lambdoid prophage Rac
MKKLTHPDTCSRCSLPRARGVGICQYHREQDKQSRLRKKQREAKEAADLEQLAKRSSPRRAALCAEKRAAAIYLRTSRVDQHPENQLSDLRKLAAARRLEIVEVYEEQISAVKERPEFLRMLEHARQGSFNAIIVWAIDRLGRNMFETANTIRELDHVGVTLVSSREPWIVDTGPVRQLLVFFFAWVAEQERVRLIERTHAGLDRARRAGKKFGRPPRMTAAMVARAHALNKDGRSIRLIAQMVNAPRSTVARALSTSHNGEAKERPFEQRKLLSP